MRPIISTLCLHGPSQVRVQVLLRAVEITSNPHLTSPQRLFERVRFLLKLPEHTVKCQSPESAKLKHHILRTFYRLTPECQVRDYMDY